MTTARGRVLLSGTLGCRAPFVDDASAAFAAREFAKSAIAGPRCPSDIKLLGYTFIIQASIIHLRALWSKLPAIRDNRIVGRSMSLKKAVAVPIETINSIL